MSNYIQYISRSVEEDFSVILGHICVEKPISNTECMIPVSFYKDLDNISLQFHFNSSLPVEEEINLHNLDPFKKNISMCNLSTMTFSSLLLMNIWAGCNPPLPNMVAGYMFLRLAQNFENENCFRYIFICAIQNKNKFFDSEDIFYEGQFNENLTISKKIKKDLSFLKGSSLPQALQKPLWGINNKFRFKTDLRLDVFEQILELHELQIQGKEILEKNFNQNILDIVKHPNPDFNIWLTNLYNMGYKPSEEYYLKDENYIRNKEEASLKALNL